jgi:outer membrane lipoprotein carrier protein
VTSPRRTALLAIAAATTLSLGASTASAGEPTAADVVAGVQKYYKDAKRFTATFEQSYENTTFGKTMKSAGKVLIKKPGNMRWDYAERKQWVKSFISDGKTLWAIEHDNKQAFKQSLKDNLLPVAVTFLLGKGKLERNFTAKLDTSSTYADREGDIVLELTPKKPSAQYKTLWLVVAPDDYRVRRSIVLEASGNTNAFTFYQPDTKSKIASGKFDGAAIIKTKKYRIVP